MFMPKTGPDHDRKFDTKVDTWSCLKHESNFFINKKFMNQK